MSLEFPGKPLVPPSFEDSKVEEVKVTKDDVGRLPVEEILKEDKPVVEELEYQKILREHGGLEGNIPINSPYWRLRP